MTGSFDTNAILRLLLGDIPEQQEQVLQLLDSATAPFAVADLVFAEAAFVMSRAYGMNRSDISQALRGLLDLPEITADKQLLHAAFKVFVDRPALSFEDSYLAAFAETTSATPLYTFDRKLANQVSGARLIASAPETQTDQS